MREHEKNKGNSDTFTGKYYCYKLIYYETFDIPEDAIQREKEIKKLSRKKKLELITVKNPKLNFYQL